MVRLVLRVLLRAAVVIDTAAGVSAVNMLFIASELLACLTGALALTVRAALSANTDAALSMDVNENVFADLTAVLKCAVPNPCEGSCREAAAVDWRPVDCTSELQAWMPPYHV